MDMPDTDPADPRQHKGVVHPLMEPGDVIFFSYYLIHWSDLNRSDQWRRSVRIGFHNAAMLPVEHDPKTPYHKVMVGGLKKRAAETKLTYR